MLIDLDTLHTPRVRSRDLQKLMLYRHISSRAHSTRKELAQILNLRSTTVSNLVQELITDRLVTEGPSKNPGRPGRPDASLIPIYDRLVGISVYVEDRRFYGSLIDLSGTLLAQVQCFIPSEAGNDFVLNRLGGILQSLIDAVPRGSELLGIGISVVGTVDSGRKIWVNADRWQEIRSLDLRILEQRLGVELILRRNLDIELEYILEMNPRFREESTVLFHWGFGVGGSYAYQGRVLESPVGRYMDIGHSIIDPGSTRQCRCGLYGCMEAEAAIYAILPILRQRFPDLREESEDIERAVASPDILELPGMRRTVELVGLCLSNLYKVFYPQRVFVVGIFFRNEQIVRQIEDYMMEHFYRKMKEKVQSVELHVIEDGFRGCAWGNVYPFFRRRMSELLSAS